MIGALVLGILVGAALATAFWTRHFRAHLTPTEYETRIERGRRAQQILVRDLGPEEYARRLAIVKRVMAELDALGVTYPKDDWRAVADTYRLNTGITVSLGSPP